MNGKKIIYQVLPRLWGDGTFPSWDEASFAYLHKLSVDYIWYTGIPRHATGKDFVKGNPGSPYAISDWYDVNPYLASRHTARMKEFQELVARTHAAGFKCLIDFIPNHVACDYRGDLAVYDWCDGDWTDTRKVNWSDPRTPAEFVKILRFWASKGVDGFRCDMVELVPPEALKDVINQVKSDYPDLLFVAEVYKKENYAAYCEFFDLLYDKSGSYDILRGIIAGERSAQELTWNWQSLGNLQQGMLNFLENHDEQRIASSWFAGTPDKAWAAAAFSILFNTASFMLYAGQEAGENAAEGHEGRTSIFEWCKPVSLQQIYSYLHTGKGLSASGKSVLARYKALLALATKDVFRTGNVWDLCYCQGSAFNPNGAFAFVRYNGRDAYAVLCNFGSAPIDLTLVFPSDLISASGIKTNRAALSAAPFDYSVIRIK